MARRRPYTAIVVMTNDANGRRKMTLTNAILDRVAELRAGYFAVIVGNANGNPESTELEYAIYQRLGRLETYLESRRDR